MTGDEWARLQDAFDRARVLPAAEREPWLSTACPDPAIRAAVVEMLATYDADPEFLEPGAEVVEAVAEALADGLVGRRLGPYRITRQIGQGGMGVVYEAARDDASFERRVAIKVLPLWSGVDAAGRFQTEQRLLASLDHPGIARLLDSGTTSDGAPYFVMEYVDGRPVDVWCRDAHLTLRERVALVERVCDAVAYAHQRLVVHRDIKTANILVTTDGTPKLLDFGIATLLAAPAGAASGLTRTGHQTFTPDFASPEQVRGEPVTTATDVYSIGVLLYLLVAGRRPYETHGLGPLELMRAICDEVPAPPSRVGADRERSAIRGDLDAIVAKALQKVPADRYAAVPALAADLRAWREGLPIQAARESRWRQARRFVRRNKAAAVVLAAIVVGGGAAAWQARAASVERDRAERRFEQVREFSRSLIFDVNEALSQVPGNTGPRRLVLDRATQFLDGLAADAGNDDALVQELIEGYRRLGRVQGDGRSRSLGDSEAAAASFSKAVALAETRHAARPREIAPIEALLTTLDELARTRRDLGDSDGAATAAARHLALAEQVARDYRNSPEALALAADALSDAGVYRAARGDIDVGLDLYARAVTLFEGLPDAQRGQVGTAVAQAFTLKRLGAVLWKKGDLASAERRYREALAVDEAVARRTPGDADVEYGVTFTLSDLGGVLADEGRADEAVPLWLRALEIRQRAADADPNDNRAPRGVAALLGRLGGYAMARGRPAEAEPHYRRALDLSRRSLALQPAQVARQAEVAWAALHLAEALLATPDDTKARQARRDEAARLLAGLDAATVRVQTVSGDAEDFGPRLDAARTRLRAHP